MHIRAISMNHGFKYVGTELAEKLYNDGDWISLEEYFGITSEYPD